MAKKGGDTVEPAKPFTNDPAHVGYGAFAFRKEDRALRDAFNATLPEWLGSEAHLATAAPFGFTRNELPGEVPAATPCAGNRPRRSLVRSPAMSPPQPNGPD